MHRVRSTASLIVIATAIVCAGAAQPPDESIVARFQSKAVRTSVSYRAKRRLEAANPRFKLSAWLEAMTESHAGRFRYTVTRRGGSELILDRVLVAALEAERELRRDGPDQVALSAVNYRFEDAGADGTGLHRIRLRPLRRDKRLIDGFLLVTPEADLVEISGRLAKPPSFWTTSVTFTRRYGFIRGVRVPLSVTSVAQVRIAGRSTFSMTYAFEEVDGVKVSPIRTDL